MASVMVRIPQSLLRRAQDTTGERDADSAVRRVLELATHGAQLNVRGRRGLEQSIRQEKTGKVRRFRTAKEAIEHLKRL